MPIFMSSVLMLPDASTAMSKSRPLRGSDSASPNHCGRAQAATNSVHARIAIIVRHRGVRAAPSDTARSRNANGILNALDESVRAGAIRRETIHGIGNRRNSHGQAHSSMSRSFVENGARETSYQRRQRGGVVGWLWPKRRVEQYASDAATEIIGSNLPFQIGKPTAPPPP